MFTNPKSTPEVVVFPSPSLLSGVLSVSKHKIFTLERYVTGMTVVVIIA